MFSVKPGRGPSLIGAIFGLVLGVPFAIFWIVTAAKMGAPGFMVFFGVIFLLAIIVQIAVGFYNSSAKNRISALDITTNQEESDPFNSLVQGDGTNEVKHSGLEETIFEKTFCPFCGAKLDQAFKFCPKCGKPQSDA